MKILLVYPKYPDTFWSFKHALKFISKKAAYPPLGLLTIASMLPKSFEKKLVDLNIKELKEKDVLWADFIFISAMLVQKKSVIEVIKLCKKFGKKIAAGGPLFNSCHEDFSQIDHFVLGEAENIFSTFLRDLKNGSLKKIYKEENHPNIARTPIPYWDLIKMKNYASMAIQYSRGCPFNCEFCDIVIMNGRVPRAKEDHQLLLEFEALYKRGWRGPVFIVDDNFIGNKIKVKKLLPKIIKWMKKRKYPFSLFTEASLNLADDEELMNLMVLAGFNKVFLGLETPIKESLAECNKFQNKNRDLVASVKKIQHFGMQVMGGFIVGFDHDPPNIFEQQIKFIQKIGVVTAMVGLLTALPGTKLYGRLKSEGRLLSVSSGNNMDTALNFVPKMNKEKLIEGYKKLLKTIYSPKNYYERILTFLKEYRPAKIRRGKILISDIKAFLKSMWQLGVLRRGRKYYWKLFFKSLFKYPKKFPVAISLAIYGFHFQKIVEQYVK
jgi:radical SAM superfamily enzyme YgiQ (UPF0313 family)